MPQEPWRKYQTPAKDGPWSKYEATPLLSQTAVMRPRSLMDDIRNAAYTAYEGGKGFVKGAAQQLGSNLYELRRMAGDQPIALPGLGVTAPPVPEEKPESLIPRGTAETIGYDLTGAAEYFAPAGRVAKGISAAGKYGRLAKGLASVGLEGTTAGGITALQGGDPLTGAATGAVTPIVGKAAQPIVEGLPAAIVNYSLRPVQKQFRFGKNPGAGVVNEGIIAMSNARLLDKLRVAQQRTGHDIGSELSGYAGPGRTDVLQHLNPIDDAIQDAVKHNDQTLVDKLFEFRQSLTDDLALDPQTGRIVSRGRYTRTRFTPEQTVGVKTRIGEGTRWTGEAFDQPLNQAKAGVYRSLRDEIERFVPSVNPLNERYANVLEAAKAAERREGLNKFIRFGDIGILGTGAAYGALSGDSEKAVSGAALLKLLTTTPGATVTAQAIRKSPGLTRALRNVALAEMNQSSSRR